MTDTLADWVLIEDMIEDVARALCCFDENDDDAWENTTRQERIIWKARAMVAINAVKLYLDEEFGDD